MNAAACCVHRVGARPTPPSARAPGCRLPVRGETRTSGAWRQSLHSGGTTEPGVTLVSATASSVRPRRSGRDQGYKPGGEGSCSREGVRGARGAGEAVHENAVVGTGLAAVAPLVEARVRVCQIAGVEAQGLEGCLAGLTTDRGIDEGKLLAMVAERISDRVLRLIRRGRTRGCSRRGRGAVRERVPALKDVRGTAGKEVRDRLANDLNPVLVEPSPRRSGAASPLERDRLPLRNRPPTAVGTPRAGKPCARIECGLSESGRRTAGITPRVYLCSS